MRPSKIVEYVYLCDVSYYVFDNNSLIFEEAKDIEVTTREQTGQAIRRGLEGHIRSKERHASNTSIVDFNYILIEKNITTINTTKSIYDTRRIVKKEKQYF